MLKKIKIGQRLINGAGIGLGLMCLAAMPAQAMAQDASIEVIPESVDANDNVTVVKDATTGKLRAPTPKEHDDLQKKAAMNKANRRIAPAVTQQKWHFSGARGARLTDEFMSASVVVRQADGSLEKHCFDSNEAAEAAMKAVGTPVNKLEPE